MADDIDIEEHDLMDNVQAKVMSGDISFDLSLVKSEPLEYLEPLAYVPDDVPKAGPPAPEPPPPLPSTSAAPDSTTDAVGPFSRAADSPHIVTSTQELVPNNWCPTAGAQEPAPNNWCPTAGAQESAPNNWCPTAGAQEPVPNNCIILGTRPRHEPRCFQTAVVLEDWGKFLDHSDSYCRACCVLFPTVNALDAHKMAAHSYLVAVEAGDGGEGWPCASCSKVFSTRKILAQHERAKHSTGGGQGASTSCFVCHATFASGSELVNHVYEHLTAEKEEKAQTPEEPKETGYQCRVCRYCFRHPQRFTQHCEEVHGAAQPLVRAPLDLTCRPCAKVIATYPAFNDHLTYNHLRARPNVLMFKCTVTGEVFLNVMMKLKHQSLFHPDGECLTSFRDSPDGYAPKTRLVPVSVAFRCSACKVHFARMSRAASHASHCGRLPTVRCDQCDRAFVAHDAETHRSQHLLSDDLAVLSTSEGLTARVLPHCPVCDVVFAEDVLYRHVGECTGPAPDAHRCVVCERSLDRALGLQHEDTHQTLDEDEYIDVRYEYIVSAFKSSLKAQLTKPAAAGAPRVVPAAFYIILYCRHCRLSFHGHNKCREDRHAKRLCAAGAKASVCKVCGLIFGSVSTLARHVAKHRQLANFDFNKYQFFDIVTDKPVKVPAPVYRYCKKHRCFSVHRCVRPGAGGDCDGESTKHCDVCSKTFTRRAHRLHMNFHNYKPKGKPMSLAEARVAKFKSAKIQGSMRTGAYTTARQLLAQGKHVHYYCGKCKSYSAQRTPHFANCRAKSYEYCPGCGMLLDAQQLVKHRQLHQQGVTLKDISVMHWKRCAPIVPPVPTFHRSPKCSINFLTLEESLNHVCTNEIPHFCSECKEKFSADAFRLHMMFHSYVADGASKAQTSSVRLPIETSAAKLNTKASKTVATIPNPKSLYRCQNCSGVFSAKQYSVHSAVAHDCSAITKHLLKCESEGCDLLFLGPTLRSHAAHSNKALVDFLPDKLPLLRLFECRHCGVHLASRSTQLHSCGEPSKSRLGLKLALSVDEKLLTTALMEDIVVHQFDRRGIDPLPKELAKPYTCYKCSRCQMFLGLRPMALAHMKRPCVGRRPREAVPCAECDLHCRTPHAHAAWHAKPDFTADNVNWVDVNQDAEGWTFTLTQCLDCNYTTTVRKVAREHRARCPGRADRVKFCDACHLALPLQYAGVHLTQHAMTPKLGAGTLRVLQYSSLTARFADDGKPARQYFQCQQCKLCLNTRTMARHPVNCRGIAGQDCRECGLRFHPVYMPRHIEKHRRVKFTGKDVTVIPFREPAYEPPSSPVKMYVNRKRKLDQRKLDQPVTKTAVMYKCACGLSFLSGAEGRAHAAACTGLNTGAQCSKCEFVLNAKDLFRHSLAHHRGEEFLFATEHVTPPKKGRAEYVYSYKCTGCDVYYLNSRRVQPHVEVCDGSNQDAVFCSVCNAMVACNLTFHMKNHRRVDQCIVIYKSPASRRTLFLCSPCNVHFMSTAAADEHARLGHSDAAAPCARCGLNINAACRSAHEQLHHKALKVLKGSFVIKPYVSASRAAALSRCLDCDVYFVGCRDFQKHLARRDFTEYEVCGKCEVKIYRDHYQEHRDDHLPSFADYDIVDGRHKEVTEGEQECEAPAAPLAKHNLQLYFDRLNRLIHCARCNVHFFKYNSFVRHSCAATPGVACGQCGLLFSARKAAEHQEIHHRQLRLRTEHLLIITFSDPKMQTLLNCQRAVEDDSVNAHLTSVNVKYWLYYDSMCDMYFLIMSSYKHHVGMEHRTQKTSVCSCGRRFLESEMRAHSRHHAAADVGFRVILNGDPNDYIIQDNRNDHSSGVKLYKCACETHFLDRAECDDHVNAKCEEETAECPECHLVFSRGAVDTHVDRHHGEGQRQRGAEDFIIVPVEKRGVKGESDVDDSFDGSAANRSVSSAELFACGACNLHFLTDADVEYHSKQADSLAEVTVVCQECHLAFYEDTHKHHSRIHHSRRSNLTRDDLIVVKSKYACAGKSEKIPVDMSIVKVEREDSSVNSDVVGTVDDAKASAVKEVSPKRKYLFKYYKCKECDVHYMRQGLCYKHAVDHKPLEVWDYVECKICALNFKVESIAYHMTIHKNKTFTAKDVLIEEYTPLETKVKKGTPIINIYYADNVPKSDKDNEVSDTAVKQKDISVKTEKIESVNDESRLETETPNGVVSELNDTEMQDETAYCDQATPNSDRSPSNAEDNASNEMETDINLQIDSNNSRESLGSIGVSKNADDEMVDQSSDTLSNSEDKCASVEICGLEENSLSVDNEMSTVVTNTV